jgi:hypothetical protein
LRIALAVLAVIALPHWPASAQKVRFVDEGFRRAAIVESVPSTVAEEAASEGEGEGEGEADSHFTESAILKTDPDIDRLMRRAHELTDDQRFDVAATLWQQVLGRAANSLRGRRINKTRRVDGRLVANVQIGVAARMAGDFAISHRRRRTRGRCLPPRSWQASLEEVFGGTVVQRRRGVRRSLLSDWHDFAGGGRLFEKIAIHPV